MPCGRKRSKKRRRKRQSRVADQAFKMVGDTAKLAIGTAAVIGVTGVALGVLKK